MDNQSVQPQVSPEPTMATIHADQGVSKRVVILGVVIFTAITVAVSLALYMNSNNQPASAVVQQSAPLLNGGSPELTSTPIPSPTISTQDADEQELESISIEDVDADMSALQDDLNQL